jgi:hypothetical protein
MRISGNLLIGAHSVPGANGSFKAINPATGAALEPRL